MPPTTPSDVVGLLLLFVPGLVAVSTYGYFGRPTTRLGNLQWLAYAIAASFALELILRVTLDPLLGKAIDAGSQPIRRAALLLAMGLLAGTGAGRLIEWVDRERGSLSRSSDIAEQVDLGSVDAGHAAEARASPDVATGAASPSARTAVRDSLRAVLARARSFLTWIISARRQPRCWIAFFQYLGWVRVEMVDGAVMAGYVKYFSNDATDSVREIVLSDIRIKKGDAWFNVPGMMLLDSSQLRSALRAPTLGELEFGDRLLTSAPDAGGTVA